MLTQELKNTLTYILAGGQGERLKPLTLERAKPAVPFAGDYRIIDFTLSNCIHSGLRRIFVLTQYRARSLEEHMRLGWNFLPRRLEQFISARPPHHDVVGKWYQGTADAIYQNIDALEDGPCDHVLVLSGDHIYQMNYGAMLQEHLDNDAAITIGAVRVPVAESQRFGILEVDHKNHVQSFLEKPEQGPEIPGRPGWCLGSMGIYLFRKDELVRRLHEDAALGNESDHDFGRNVIPKMIGETRVIAHHFVDLIGSETPYWRDVGTIDAYYEANLDLCSVQPNLNLYRHDWPIYTLWHNDPPAKTIFDDDDRRAEVVDSLLCPGVIVSGARVRRSILASRVFAEDNCLIEESIVMRGAVVGKGAKLRRTIVDKWIEIPEGTEIGYDLEQDRKRFTVTDSGIVVVPKGFKF